MMNDEWLTDHLIECLIYDVMNELVVKLKIVQPKFIIIAFSICVGGWLGNTIKSFIIHHSQFIINH
jgi:hypothetical protein